MKKLQLVFISCMLCYVSSNAQWYWQNPLPQGHSINALFFIDEYNGWAVGAARTIIHTTDGGITWKSQESGGSWYDWYGNIEDVFFTDLNNGWAVGGVPTFIIHTHDGGTTWWPQMGEKRWVSALTGVCFTDHQTGWAVGYAYGNPGPHFYRTADGGNSWEYQNCGLEGDSKSVFFIDQLEGWIAGYGTILHTMDGGMVWEPQDIDPTLDLEQVFFIDPNKGWAVGEDGTVLLTSNGGEVWESSQDTSLSGIHVRDVSFINDSTGWICGFYDGVIQVGIILKTTNGGLTWQKQFSDPPMVPIHCLAFIDESTGFAAGDHGEMFKAMDGGDGWARISSCVTTCDFRDVFFTDIVTGWASGWITTGDDHVPAIYHTVDGGITWTNQEVPLSGNQYVQTLFFTDAQHGWALGWDEYQGGYQWIHTTDGGETWLLQSTEETGSDLFFINSMQGWRVGMNGAIQKTGDGGWNWFDQQSGTDRHLFSIIFIDDHTGWIAGDSIILNTKDAGQTWVVQSSGIFEWYDIFFVNTSHGWVFGPGGGYGKGKTMRTTDGGQMWEEIFIDHDFYEVFFSDTLNGWGRCRTIYGGCVPHPLYNIMSTHDGGLTWDLHSAGGEAFCFVDANHGWVVGEQGKILHTNNGGALELHEFPLPPPTLQIQLSPNPTWGMVDCQLSIANGQLVKLNVYNAQGQEVMRIMDRKLPDGEHVVRFDLGGLPEGIYFVRLQAEDKIMTGKVVKAK